MKLINLTLGIITLLSGVASATPEKLVGNTTVLYGVDANHPDIKKLQDTLVPQAIHVYGTRKKASMVYARSSADLYKRGKTAEAIDTLNQAWVLDNNNPDVYVIYGKLLFDRKDYCAAGQMFERTVTLQPVYPQYPNIYLVMARDYALCIKHDKNITPSTRKELLAKIKTVLTRAETDNHAPLPKVYQNWAAIDYILGNYTHAWRMVDRMKAVGGEPPEKFLKMLKARQAEPDNTDLTPPTTE